MKQVRLKTNEHRKSPVHVQTRVTREGNREPYKEASLQKFYKCVCVCVCVCVPERQRDREERTDIHRGVTVESPSNRSQ